MKFRTIKELGKGSQGEVMLVKSSVNPRTLVMKKVHIGELTSKQRALTEKEAHILKQMRHSNIIRFEHSFTKKQFLYIFTEFADGGDLAKSITFRKKSKREFQETQAMKIFAQICFALKHVHDRQILHRDLKPSNIFLMRNGIVKLGDFGISKILDSTLSLAATKVGTPYYLSPEICQDRPYGKASDIWAMGAILYEMMTLSMPFQAKSFHSLVNKILCAEPDPLPNKHAKDCNELCIALLSKDPSNRPSVNHILNLEYVKAHAERCLSYTITSDGMGVANELGFENHYDDILDCSHSKVEVNRIGDTTAMASNVLVKSNSIQDNTTELNIQIPHSIIKQASCKQQIRKNPYASRHPKGCERKNASTPKPVDSKGVSRKGKALLGGRNERGKISAHAQGNLHVRVKRGSFEVQHPTLKIENHKNSTNMNEHVICKSKLLENSTTINPIWEKSLDGDMEPIEYRKQKSRKQTPDQGKGNFSRKGKRSTSKPKSAYTAEILGDCNTDPMTLSKDLSKLQIICPDGL